MLVFERISSRLAKLAPTLLLAALVACQGSNEPELNPVPADLPANPAEASRFLGRATFGPTPADLDHLSQVGFQSWLEEQRLAPPTLIRPALEAELLPGEEDVFENDARRKELWWEAVLLGPDQLRQRMAWALSQLLVISTQDMEVVHVPLGVAEYQDILVAGAFGNYRELLEKVTLSPVMGMYLDMLKNRLGDPDRNLRPDENFAREILQLFSIGLVQLAPDGSVLLEDGKPIPTYDQPVVEGFARVFTGWTFAGNEAFFDTPEDPLARGVWPMEPFEVYHEPGEKLLLDGVVLPPGLGAQADLEAALDLVFEHPNVGPFVAEHLIQRFVTSNPEPAYVGRVAAAFDDNGEGVRGDLWATVVAVLTDEDALRSSAEQPPEFGKLREPLLRLAGLWRTFDAEPLGGAFDEIETLDLLGQGPLEAPSVFNFYDGDFSPAGELSNLGLAAPEFQITTHRGIAEVTNRLFEAVLEDHVGFPFPEDDDIVVNLDPWLSLAHQPELLVDELNVLLMGGTMSEAMRETVVLYASTVPLDLGADQGAPPGVRRLAETVNLIVSSPEGAIER